MERFFDYFEPEHYDLTLDINAAKNNMDAVAIITGRAKEETIKFHAAKLKIKNLKIDGEDHDYARENGVVVVSGVNTSKKIKLEFEYYAPIETDMQGVYLSTYKNGDTEEKIVATQFESHYARECFPCIDEPAAKATFDLTITTKTPTDTILANMPVKEEKLEPNQKTVSFERTPKMSTYLLAFAV